MKQATSRRASSRDNLNRVEVAGPSVAPRGEFMIVPLVALTIGIANAWQLNAARPATPKASEVEAMGVVDLIAAVIKRTRRVNKLQRALVIARTGTD